MNELPRNHWKASYRGEWHGLSDNTPKSALDLFKESDRLSQAYPINAAKAAKRIAAALDYHRRNSKP